MRVYECLGFKDDAATQKLHECIIERWRPRNPCPACPQPVLCNADRPAGCAGDRYSAAFDLYLNRKFTEALAGFEELQVRVVSCMPLVRVRVKMIWDRS